MPAMHVNDRVRRKVADQLDDGETIAAMIAMNYMLGGGYANSDGVVGGGSSLYSTPYAERLGIDFDDATLRGQLVTAWCAATDRRLLFWAPSKTSVRPTPGKFLEALPLADTTLRYFDMGGLSMSTRGIHLDFADGTRVLSATMLKGTLRKKKFNDEPDLFVQAFGDRAIAVDSA